MRPYPARLEAARRLAATTRTGGPPPFPGHVVDQLGAATTEAHWLMMRLAVALGATGWRAATGRGAPDDEVIARVVAALSDLHFCPHLLHGAPQPAWARLALHRVDCARCTATVRKPPADEDDRCDWCDARGVEWFMPVALQLGPVLAMGDACASCAEALRLPAEVAG